MVEKERRALAGRSRRGRRSTREPEPRRSRPSPGPIPERGVRVSAAGATSYGVTFTPRGRNLAQTPRTPRVRFADQLHASAHADGNLAGAALPRIGHSERLISSLANV